VTRVQLPNGCYKLDMANGVSYKADKPGGSVEVTGRDAHFIDTSFYGQTGIMRGSAQFAFGTRKGRLCEACNRLWNVWSTECPRCGEGTTPYGGM
jgi:hypothetical protein